MILFDFRNNFACLNTSLKHSNSERLTLLKSMITLDDCLSALRKLFSIVRLLLPSGDLISHSSPRNKISAVCLIPGGKNSTSPPDQDKIVAAINS